MEYTAVKTSKRFLSFLVDMILITLLIQLLLFVFKTPIENIFHLDQLTNDFNTLGQQMGVFNESNQFIQGLEQSKIDAFYANEEVKLITTTFRKNQMILVMILSFISSSIFQFIIPAIAGDGRTIGKMLAKLKVVKMDGSKINFLTIFLRGFVGMTLIEYVISAPIGFLPFMISAMLVFVSNNKRALHDYIAGTRVAYVDGFEPTEKVKEKSVVDPYHKSTKGFEYIDTEAIEKREAMNKQIAENVEEEKIEPRKVSDITMDEIEMKEKMALERMKQNKEENK